MVHIDNDPALRLRRGSFLRRFRLLFRQKIQDNRNDWLKLYSGYSKVFDRELAAIVASLENPYAG